MTDSVIDLLDNALAASERSQMSVAELEALAGALHRKAKKIERTVEDRRLAAVQMRCAGYSYEEIARACRYVDSVAAFAVVRDQIRKIQNDEAPKQ